MICRLARNEVQVLWPPTPPRLLVRAFPGNGLFKHQTIQSATNSRLGNAKMGGHLGYGVALVICKQAEDVIVAHGLPDRRLDCGLFGYSFHDSPFVERCELVYCLTFGYFGPPDSPFYHFRTSERALCTDSTEKTL